MTTPESILSRMRGLIKQGQDVSGYLVHDVSSAMNVLALGYERPIAYEDAKDGEKLYNVHFASGRFRAIDDTKEYFSEGGTTYLANGDVSDPPLTQWRRSLVADPDAMVGSALIIHGSDTTAVDHRLIGYFPEYDLENKTYTYEFQYFRNFNKRHKFYFANGNFVNEGGGVVDADSGCDPTIPCLALELNYASGNVDYKLYRQSKGFVNACIYNRKTVPFEKDSSGEFTAQMKVVLEGGAKQTSVTLYERHGVVSEASKPYVNYWTGDIIPITYTIYHTVNGENIKVAGGYIYQPADIGLVFGIGNYDALSSDEWYGVRDLVIYKGDRTIIAPSADVEVYEGNYAVTPQVSAQTLKTAQKYLSNDITIQEIPYAEVSNSAGGTTATIG